MDRKDILKKISDRERERIEDLSIDDLKDGDSNFFFDEVLGWEDRDQLEEEHMDNFERFMEDQDDEELSDYWLND